MAAKLSFQLDAGKILAKLHRGACETHPNMLFFNTGILNDQKIAPDQVNNAKINFDIVEGGKYELGVIIDQETSIKLGASIEDIVKQFTEYAKKNGGEQGSEKDQGKEQA